MLDKNVQAGLMPLVDHNGPQLKEIFSGPNRWFAGQEFGHDPSPLELVLHYIHCGRAAEIASQHNRDSDFLGQTGNRAPSS